MSIEISRAAEIESLALASRNGWPEDLRVLIAQHPREQWEIHTNLGEMARFWLSRHVMFRELSVALGNVTTQFRAGLLRPAEFAQQFVPQLQFMLDQLNVHHQIEDLHYFPIFKAAEARLALGFDVLERDHHHIHADMARTAESANALLQALRAGGDGLSRCSENYATVSASLMNGLVRHLDDEEDLIVPLILDRGEEELGVAHHL